MVRRSAVMELDTQQGGNMQNWKISTRLAAAFGMLVVLLLGVAGAALLQLSTLNAVTKQITSNNLISVELINKLGPTCPERACWSCAMCTTRARNTRPASSSR
jgi:hypothetical protein